MKRILSTLLAVCMVISLAACAVNTPPAPDEEKDPPVTDPTPPAPPPEQETPPAGNNENTDLPPENDPTPDDTTDQPSDPPEDPTEQDENNNQNEEDNQGEGENQEESEEYVRVIDPSRPMVALTFDDGPHEQFTPQILDILEANHSVATFFEVGYNAVRYPDLLRRTLEIGCEIGSHSYYHYDLTTLSKDAMLSDLAKLDKVIYNATGFTPTLVRPPYGAVNSTVKYTSGRAMILWTIDTKDWQYRDAQVLIDYIQNYGDLDGEIVLMHSIHGSTADAMETVIPWLIEQGYQLVTVSELMAYYYGVLLEANHYYNQNYFAKRGRTEFPIELPEKPMKTEIPEFTTVPIKPDTPPEGSDTPPEGTDTPPEGTDTPPEGTDTPPEGTDTPPEGTDTPPEEDPVIPPEEGSDENESDEEDNSSDGEPTPPDASENEPAT